MGICRVVFLSDEYDWDYVGVNKQQLIADALEKHPNWSLAAAFTYWIVVDIDKSDVSDILNLIPHDVMYVVEGSSGRLIEHFE